MVKGQVLHELHPCAAIAVKGGGKAQTGNGMTLTVNGCCSIQRIQHIVGIVGEVCGEDQRIIDAEELIVVGNVLQIFYVCDLIGSIGKGLEVIDHIALMTVLYVGLLHGQKLIILHAGGEEGDIRIDLLSSQGIGLDLAVDLGQQRGQSDALRGIQNVGSVTVEMDHIGKQFGVIHAVRGDVDGQIPCTDGQLIAVQGGTGGITLCDGIGDAAGGGVIQGQHGALGCIKLPTACAVDHGDLTGLALFRAETDGLGNGIIGIPCTGTALACNVAAVQQPSQLTGFIIIIVQLYVGLAGMGLRSVPQMTCAVNVAEAGFLTAAVIADGTRVGTHEALACVKGVEIGGGTLRVTGQTACIGAAVRLGQDVSYVEAEVHRAGTGQTGNTGTGGIVLIGEDVGCVPAVIDMASITLCHNGTNHDLGFAGVAQSTDLTAGNTQILDGGAAATEAYQTDLGIGRGSSYFHFQVFDHMIMTVDGALEIGACIIMEGQDILVLHIHVVEEVDGDAGEVLAFHVTHGEDLFPIGQRGNTIVLSVVECGIKRTLGGFYDIGILILQNGGNGCFVSHQLGSLLNGRDDQIVGLLFFFHGEDGLGIVDDLLNGIAVGEEVDVVLLVVGQNIGGYGVVGIRNIIAQNHVGLTHGKACSGTACGDGRLVQVIALDGLDGHGIPGMIISIRAFGHRAVGEPLLYGHFANGIRRGSEDDLAVDHLIKLAHAALVGEPVSRFFGAVGMLGTDRALILIAEVIVAGVGHDGVEVVDVGHVTFKVCIVHNIADLVGELTDGTNGYGRTAVLDGGYVGPAVLNG